MEKKIIGMGTNYTVLRFPTFMEDFLIPKTVMDIKYGYVRLPIKHAKWPPVAVPDVGEAMATALMMPSMGKQIFDITGPTEISGKDIADTFTKTLGREVKYVDITPEDFHADVTEIGFPDWQAPGFVELVTWYTQGKAHATMDFKKLTGKDAMTFEAWVRSHFDDFK